MRRTRFDDWPCPIARTTDLIGDWWTPLVMREAFYGRRRFEEFQTSLDAPACGADGPAQPARATRGCCSGSSTSRHPPRLRVPAHRQGARVLGRAGGDVALGQRLAVARRARSRRSCSRIARPATIVTPARDRRAHRRTPRRPPPAHGPQPRGRHTAHLLTRRQHPSPSVNPRLRRDFGAAGRANSRRKRGYRA